jgi:DGQHR domain-containing protein
MNPLVCPAFEVKQPIGTFYVTRMSSLELIYITFADIRRIQHEDSDIERVFGIQRPLSQGRVREIQQYVNTLDAAFPSSIILSINSLEGDKSNPKDRNISYTDGHLKIKYDQNVAKILDGQHRIEGLKGLEAKNAPFNVIVTIFVDADIEQQAMIFSTINKSQTKVNKSLVYDLFDYAKSRSPEKLGHNIAILFNRKEGSPFKDRIKILGTADDVSMETITQANFVESLLKHITDNPMRDRDFIKRNPGKALPPIAANDSTRFVLRGLFAESEDAKIASTILNYFIAVAAKWPEAWNTKEEGLILNKSTGFIALMRLIRPIYISKKCPNEAISQREYTALLAPITLVDSDFNKEKFIPGSSGQGLLYNTLLAQAKLSPP